MHLVQSTAWRLKVDEPATYQLKAELSRQAFTLLCLQSPVRCMLRLPHPYALTYMRIDPVSSTAQPQMQTGSLVMQPNSRDSDQYVCRDCKQVHSRPLHNRGCGCNKPSAAAQDQAELLCTLQQQNDMCRLSYRYCGIPLARMFAVLRSAAACLCRNLEGRSSGCVVSPADSERTQQLVWRALFNTLLLDVIPISPQLSTSTVTRLQHQHQQQAGSTYEAQT